MSELLHTFCRFSTYSNRDDAGFAGFSHLFTLMQTCILYFKALLHKIKILIKIREYPKYVTRHTITIHSFYNNKSTKAYISNQKVCKVCNNREKVCTKYATTMWKAWFLHTSYMVFTHFYHFHNHNFEGVIMKVKEFFTLNGIHYLEFEFENKVEGRLFEYKDEGVYVIQFVDDERVVFREINENGGGGLNE